MLRGMSSDEFWGWLAYYRSIGGFPVEREDTRWSMLTYMSAQALSYKKGARRPKLDDFKLMHPMSQPKIDDLELVEHTDDDVSVMKRLLANAGIG